MFKEAHKCNECGQYFLSSNCSICKSNNYKIISKFPIYITFGICEICKIPINTGNLIHFKLNPIAIKRFHVKEVIGCKNCRIQFGIEKLRSNLNV